MAILKKRVKNPRPPQEYTAQTAARDALRIAQYKTLDTKPLDVEALVSALGIRLQPEIMDNDISGYLRASNGDWIIGVNSLHHPNRRRFTIAHELGHYFLHRHIGNFEDRALFRRERQSNPQEWEANDFAASLLMPSSDFRMALANTNGDLEAVARQFGVSKLATSFRQESIRHDLGVD